VGPDSLKKDQNAPKINSQAAYSELSANMSRFVKTVALCSIPIAVSLFSHDAKQPADSGAYSHGTILCLQGDDGPGLRLLLTQKHTCEGRLSYPRLEIDIKEEPVPVRKSIVIGPDNLAFRCLNPKESCEQLVSGELFFEHFEHRSKKTEISGTDGHYELRFRTRTERGRFKVDCVGICG
jgi:hypothetical protein